MTFSSRVAYVRLILFSLLAFVSIAQAQVSLDLVIRRASDGQSTITVAPGETVEYEIEGVLSPAAGHLGLGVFAFNLNYEGGELPQADTPVAPSPMANFVIPLGITEPAGYGGDPRAGGKLHHVGGGQNTIGNTPDVAPYPIGEVILGIAQSEPEGLGPEILATGSFQAPEAEGEYSLVLSGLFVWVIQDGQSGEDGWWRTEEAQAGTITNLTIEVKEPAKVLQAFPPVNTRLWRTQKNIVFIRFDKEIAAPGPGEIEIRQMLQSGLFGPNLATDADFTFAVEYDGAVGRTRVLRMEDLGNHLFDRAWFSISNISWPDAEAFDLHFVCCAGDANNDNRVNSIDLAFVNSRICGCTSPIWTSIWADPTLQNRFRSNVNGDNFVNTLDLVATNARISPRSCPPKPSGH